MKTPAAEIEIDVALVAELLRAQHPDLTGPLRPVTNGWDNVIYRLGEQLCVRLPRREFAAPLVRHEQQWLPRLAPQLPVAVPVPVRLGTPTSRFPWHWSVYPWLAGQPATALPAAARRGCAADLARFMAALHRPAPATAPTNPVRAVPLATRAAALAERLASGRVPYAARLRRRWRELVAAPPWPGPPVWVHGDPHPGNLLVDAGRLSAVIDFGDLSAGDPATDLAAGWLVFDAAGRELFHAELARRGAVDPATWQRAEGWAIVMATALATASADNPAMAAIATHTLGQLLD